MRAPVQRLKKSELVWLGLHNCKHGHSYLEHYSCFLNEAPVSKRVGYLDIETSNLDADFGIMLCYCIKEAGVDFIHEGVITQKEATHATTPDKRLVEQCIEDIKKFDLLYGYYSSKFDMKFIRTRAVSMNIDFPSFGTLKHKDIYYVVKNKFKLHSNRLEVACNELLGHSDKTHFDGNIWRQAVQGDKKALGYILSHCENDVLDLEKLVNKVIDFAYPSVVSL
jgi:uncharacterized protein YprB with RNaseH-like and TPR domain